MLSYRLRVPYVIYESSNKILSIINVALPIIEFDIICSRRQTTLHVTILNIYIYLFMRDHELHESIFLKSYKFRKTDRA